MGIIRIYPKLNLATALFNCTWNPGVPRDDNDADDYDTKLLKHSKLIKLHIEACYDEDPKTFEIASTEVENATEYFLKFALDIAVDTMIL